MEAEVCNVGTDAKYRWRHKFNKELNRQLYTKSRSIIKLYTNL